MENRGGLKTSILLLSLTALLASGCGRGNTIYSDAKDPAADSITIRDGRSLLPDGFLDQSEGDGLVQVLNPAASDSSVRLSGNRAILGITNYDSLKLADLSIEFTTKESKPLTLALLLDRTCDSGEIETIFADLDSGSALRSDVVVWKTEDSALPVSIDEILSQSPNACLKNGVSTAAGFPTLPIGAVLLLNGEPDSTSAETIELQTLKLQSDTFNTWGAQ